MPDAQPTPRLLPMVAGPALWALLFIASYVFSGFGCASDALTVAGLRTTLVGIAAVVVILLVWLAFMQARQLRTIPGQLDDNTTGRDDPHAFLCKAALLLTVGALAATLWLGLNVAITPLCDPPPA